jgi:hypothetical protein
VILLSRLTRINSRENRVFLIKKFLVQGDIGKMGIQKYRGVFIMNLDNLGENFIIFG